MKRWLPILILTFLLQACDKQSTTIMGQWNGNDTTLYLTQYKERAFVLIDSIQIKDGKFTWKGHLDKNYLYGFTGDLTDRHPAAFFPTDADSMFIHLWPKGSIAVQDSPLNDLLQQTLATTFLPDTLVSRHPDSPVTAYIATRYLTSSVSYDSLLLFRKQIIINQHPYTKELDATIEAMKRIHPGAYAPSISQEFKDTTLLVFHATWCPDCKRAWPDIQTYMQTHPSTHLITLNIDSIGWNSEEAQAYAVRGVPSIFLIYKGKIIKTKL